MEQKIFGGESSLLFQSCRAETRQDRNDLRGGTFQEASRTFGHESGLHIALFRL
jgi:hypothetical protein